MIPSDLHPLQQTLQCGIADLGAAPRLLLAFSGGGDSSALLHALSRLRDVQAFNLRAAHIHHGLHADADHWAQHCQQVCDQLAVPLDIVRVQVDPQADSGIEAAARDARYRALFALMTLDEHLLLAQHREDQAETVLLRLLRGAGSAGLAAMREHSRRQGHRLWRPWLGESQQAIRAYLQQHALTFIEDPANTDPRFARSLLRQQVMPMLRQHWPSIDSNLARTASALRIDAERLQQRDREHLALAQAVDPDSVSIATLLQLNTADQHGLLRAWLQDRGVAAMPTRIMQRVVPDLLHAAEDAEAELRWASHALRRYRDLLYLLHQAERPPPPSCAWDGRTTLQFGDWTLRFEAPPRAPLPLHCRTRQGSERIRLPQRSHRHDLNKLLQQAAVPPWQRQQLPLLCIDSAELAAFGVIEPYTDFVVLAVADRFRSEALRQLETRLGIRLHMQRN